MISCGTDRYTSTHPFTLAAGNNQGEVFIYSLLDKEMVLQDMILLNTGSLSNSSSSDEHIVRNLLRVSENTIAITTEAGDLQLFEYKPQQPILHNMQDLLMSEDPEMQEEEGDK